MADDKDQRPTRMNRPEQRQTPLASTAAQVAMGFGAWVVFIALVAAIYGAFSYNRQYMPISSIVAILALGGFVALCVYVYRVYHWRAFVPGALLGFGVTCLLPVGIIVVLCGGWKL